MFDNRQWYAVWTRSNCESKVSSLLTEKGIENYLPSFREVRQWKDRKKVIEVPIFSGYLFARFSDVGNTSLTVLRTDGVVSVLGRGEAIEAIPDYEIEAIRKLLSTGSPFSAHPLLREGAWVRVKSGALSGVEGLLVRVKNQSRLVLSITLLGKSVSTEIDASNVQVLRAARAQVSQIA